MYKFMLKRKQIGKAKSIANKMRIDQDPSKRVLAGLILAEEAFLKSTNQKHIFVQDGAERRILDAKIDSFGIPAGVQVCVHFESPIVVSKTFGKTANGLFVSTLMEDGDVVIDVSIRSGKGWYPYCCGIATEDYIEEWHEKYKTGHLELKSSIDKIAEVALAIHSTSKMKMKDGIWRKKIREQCGNVDVVEVSKPKGRSPRMHFRQLRHERYYRGEHENKERGSRYVLVNPDGDGTIETVMNFDL